jgi:hypothetical protein
LKPQKDGRKLPTSPAPAPPEAPPPKSFLAMNYVFNKVKFIVIPFY